MKTAIAYLFLPGFLLVSCAGEKKESHQVSVRIPEKVEIYNSSVSAPEQAAFFSGTDKEFKIYTLINVSCSSCLFKLEKWDSVSTAYGNGGNIAVIPVCYSKDNFELLKFLFEDNKIPKLQMSLVLDVADSFRVQNDSLVKALGDFTALTDRNNQVILTGNPIEDSTDRVKFMQAISGKSLTRL